MITIPERSTAWLTVSFKNRVGDPEAPATAEYRVDTVEGGELRPWTPLVNPAASLEVTLTPGDNAIVDDTKKFQTNVVTVHTTYGTNDERNEPYFYRVRNLSHIPKS